MRRERNVGGKHAPRATTGGCGADGGGTLGGSAGRLAPPCVVGGFQSALEKDVLLELGQIGVRALRTELECAWVMARARASAASFWGSSSSARSVLTMR